jgi:ABC-type phosphate transport system substrate-binding protein
MRASSSVLLALLWLASAGPLRAEGIVVIVHPQRESRLDLEELARIYLKQRRHWPGGDAIVPVNREAGSPVRDAFAGAVLARTPQQLAVYWNRQYFQGVLPPATLASDEAVKLFVAREKRAIGYIRESALDSSVRAVLRVPESTPPSRR